MQSLNMYLFVIFIIMEQIIDFGHGKKFLMISINGVLIQENNEDPLKLFNSS